MCLLRFIVHAHGNYLNSSLQLKFTSKYTFWGSYFLLTGKRNAFKFKNKDTKITLIFLAILKCYKQMLWRQLLFLTHFMPLVFFLYPLKTSENLWLSDVFRGYRKRPVAWNGLILLFFTYKYKTLTRSGPPDVFLVKGVLRICSKITEEHPCRSVISTEFLCNAK